MFRILIWEQQEDGRYVYDVVDEQEEANAITKGNPNLYTHPTTVEWTKGEKINNIRTHVYKGGKS